LHVSRYFEVIEISGQPMGYALTVLNFGFGVNAKSKKN
jgi:hypothetical protein